MYVFIDASETITTDEEGNYERTGRGRESEKEKEKERSRFVM